MSSKQRWVNHDGDEVSFRCGPIGVVPAHGSWGAWKEERRVAIGFLFDADEQRVWFNFIKWGFSIERLWRDE